MESIVSGRRVQRVRHELVRRVLQVRRVQSLGPGFAAITFGGDALAGFVSLSFDDHVKLFFDDGSAEPPRRDYTPRRYDPVAGELTIEFALHGPGPAADWARQAQPGQSLTIGGPRGSMIVPTDYDWHLLAADASALPALHRRLEELPASTRAIAVVQLDDAADRRDLQSAAALELHWAGPGPDALLRALQALPLPAGEGYVWCAGEADEMARVRELMLARHPREAMRVAAYWKRGASDYHERLEG